MFFWPWGWFPQPHHLPGQVNIHSLRHRKWPSRNSWFMLIYLLKIVIFNSHVSLPEDIRDAKRLSGFLLFLLATTGSGLGAGHPLLKTGEVSVNQRQITATPSSVSLYHQKCGSSSNRFTGRYPPFQRQKASQLASSGKGRSQLLAVRVVDIPPAWALQQGDFLGLFHLEICCRLALREIDICGLGLKRKK